MTRATAISQLGPGPAGPRIRPREPDLRATAAALAVWYVEHRAGRRCVTQLHAGLTPTLRHRLAQRVVHQQSLTAPHPVLRVVEQQPCADSREALVLIGGVRDRVTAVCVRFERHGTRWLVAELSAPEDGEPPVVTDRALLYGPDAFDIVSRSGDVARPQAATPGTASAAPPDLVRLA